MEIDTKELQQKIYQKLVPSGWGNRLKGFILSEDFKNIIIKLNKSVEAGKRFSPTFKQIFRCFEECPYDNLKVVMLFDKPYSIPKMADGIPISSNLGEQECMRNMINEIRETMYIDQPGTISDMTFWTKQGVLMLNASLTTELYPGKDHFKIWEPFIVYLLDMLKAYNPGLVYAVLGKENARLLATKHLEDENPIFSTDPTEYNSKFGNWESQHLLIKINDKLIFNNGESAKINWLEMLESN